MTREEFKNLSSEEKKEVGRELLKGWEKKCDQQKRDRELANKIYSNGQYKKPDHQ